MKIHEYQAKGILKKYGVTVPRGTMATTREEAATWKTGEVLLLSGKLLTGRDAAHKRMSDMLNRGEKLPVDFRNRFIYYVGPVDPVRDEVVFAAQAKVPRLRSERVAIVGWLAEFARGHPDMRVVIKLRAVSGEKQTHAEQFPYDELLDDLDSVPPNLTAESGSTTASWIQLLETSRLMAAFSSRRASSVFGVASTITSSRTGS